MSGKQVGVEAVAAHRHDQLPSLVVEQQPGALHRADAAERLAEPVVEAGPAGTGWRSSSSASSSTITSSASVRAGDGLAMACCTR